ncbi:MAG: hypothetical protein VKL42_11855 [Snowella sp.]|nr:hypothetical protein [Snowella sp.]
MTEDCFDDDENDLESLGNQNEDPMRTLPLPLFLIISVIHGALILPAIKPPA